MTGAASEPRPDVIVDVIFEEGLLYLAVANIGPRPALNVRCTFDQRFRGLGGRKEMSRLALFRKLEFLAPGKEIRTLLDSSADYFARKEPTKLAVTVRWRDAGGHRYQTPLTHDLEIYRDLAFGPRHESDDSVATD